jgi:hypothetical protein
MPGNLQPKAERIRQPNEELREPLKSMIAKKSE